MNNLVKNEGGKLRVSGRLLHKECKVEQRFNDWMPKQIENVDAEEDSYDIVWLDKDSILFKEYASDDNIKQLTGMGYKQDYILDIELAKEICMVMGIAPRTNPETKKLSKQTRKYFIECEKQLKEIKTPKLTKEQQLQLTILNGTQEESLLALKEYQILITQPLIDVIDELSPLAEKYNIFMDAEGLTNIETFSQNLSIKGLGRNNMYKYFREKGYLKRDNKPYQYYIDNGWFKLRPSGHHMERGEIVQDYKTFLTTKGVNKTIDVLIKEGYINN